MTTANPDSVTRIEAFRREHGEAYGIIEFSGQDREKHTGGLFEDANAAWRYVRKHYDADEVESLGVDVARWDSDGQFWSYDH